VKAATFLKYFILGVVAFNLAIVAYVLVRGMEPKRPASNSAVSQTNTTVTPSAPSTN
jgi:hypothetical protein